MADPAQDRRARDDRLAAGRPPDPAARPIRRSPAGRLTAAVTVPVPIATSYFQYDQQGVVFNMWYFGWFDDAMTQFLGEIGYPYTALNADGLDVQLVHTEADWRDAVRYGEQVVIDVVTERIGSTSFTLSFAVRVGEQVRSTGRTVYVMVSTDGSGKRPVPPKLRVGLETALTEGDR
jgi:acyl-CoA thioester hydrolase